MPSTIAQGFEALKSNLEITDLQRSVVSTRQETVRGVVQAGLTVKDSFLTGSYARQTMIAPLTEADIDIFMVLDSRYFYQFNGQNGGVAGLLELVKQTLRRTYTRTPDISRNGQAVTIRFEDFIVDVVPGFDRQGGGYLIPNSNTQSWISTDPKRHVEIISNANQVHNGNFIPLVKMLKAWNKKDGGFFYSFHIEVLALAILQGITISDFPSGARFFFDKARAAVAGKNIDPAGFGGDVGSYINGQDKIQQAVYRLQKGLERSLNAEAAGNSGNVRGAFDLWAQVFGPYFPSYGY
jgi:hypothetical protein